MISPFLSRKNLLLFLILSRSECPVQHLHSLVHCTFATLSWSPWKVTGLQTGYNPFLQTAGDSGSAFFPVISFQDLIYLPAVLRQHLCPHLRFFIHLGSQEAKYNAHAQRETRSHRPVRMAMMYPYTYRYGYFSIAGILQVCIVQELLVQCLMCAVHIQVCTSGQQKTTRT